jgi:hypothetical protein
VVNAIPASARPKLLFVVTEDWYFCSHRLPLARAARDDGYEVLVAARMASHADRIRAEGFRPIPLRLRRRRSNPWNEVASIIELVKLYRREKPDIVHHVAMKPVIYGSLAALIARVPNIVNALAGFGYVFTSTQMRARLLRWPVCAALRWLLSAGKGCTIVQNPDDARALLDLGIADGRGPEDALDARDRSNFLLDGLHDLTQVFERMAPGVGHADVHLGLVDRGHEAQRDLCHRDDPEHDQTQQQHQGRHRPVERQVEQPAHGVAPDEAARLSSSGSPAPTRSSRVIPR